MKRSKREMCFLAMSVLVFSFCIVLMSEYIQRRNSVSVLGFVFAKPGVVAFCTVVVSFFTMAIIYITKSVFAGSAVSGFFAYTLSCVEFFKYSISGSHLVVADLGFLFNAGEIAGFADIKPEAHLVRALAFLVFLLIVMYHVRVSLPGTVYRGVAGAAICVAAIAALISPSSATQRTYSVLDFDTVPALTTMAMNKRFENDGFLGFLSQNATEHISSGIDTPDGYSKEFMEEISSSGFSKGDKRRPNVVIIASESFSDLRDISDEDIQDEIYEGFDKASALGEVGECILPTFGGYTVRSEFELLFGLPSLSMSNVPSPHSMLDEKREQNTIVGMYRDAGYMTTYIHAFEGSFYDRDEMYAKYGFERFVFSDAFDASEDMFRRYISDDAVTRKIKQTLEEDDEPSFIFAMTMQNHQPYIDENASIYDELGYYLEGIERSSQSLYELVCWLGEFEEDTVLLFVGDHLPFFTPQGGVYERLGVYDNSVEQLYTQKYIIYSNYEKKRLTDSKVSLFYLPHLLIEKSGIGYGEFTGTMLDMMEREPVYSIVSDSMGENDILDAITYDRTLGDCWLK